MTQPSSIATICTQCAVGIVNDDWTFLDNSGLTNEESYDELQRRLTNADYLDPLGDMKGPIDLGGYYTCWICDEVDIATAYQHPLKEIS